MKHLILIALLFFPTLVLAQETQGTIPDNIAPNMAQPSTEDGTKTPVDDFSFTTPACDFKAEMPGKYFPQIICQDEDKERCTSKARFTDMDEKGGLAVDMLCVPMEPGYYDIYSEDLIAAFSKRILKEYGIEDPEAQFNFEEEEDLKLRNSTAIAKGTFGQFPLLMIVQFWYTPRSMMTTEIRIIGNHTEELDQKASKVIQSTRLKDGYMPPSEPIEPFSPSSALP